MLAAHTATTAKSDALADLAIVSATIVSGIPVGTYEMLEVEAHLNKQYANPYDPSYINVYAMFYGPGGIEVSVDGFYFVKHERNVVVDGCVGNFACESYTAHESSWRVRASFNTPGKWKCRLYALDTETASQYSEELKFSVEQSEQPGYVARADQRYLSRTTGEGYFPVGLNLGWAPSAVPEHGTNAYEEWMAQMKENEMNHARIWINSGWSISLQGYDEPTAEMFGLHDNQKDAAQLDRIFSLAVENGIDLTLSIFAPAAFENTNWTDRNGWYSGNGGPLNYPFELFFEQNDVHVKNHLRYVMARWGYSNRLLGYELWNEVDAIAQDEHNVFTPPGNPACDTPQERYDIVRDWHNRMFEFMRNADPYHHLLCTSTRFFSEQGEVHDLIAEITADIVQSHQYHTAYQEFDLQMDGTDVAAKMINWFSKPHIHGETGLDENPALLNDLDPHGMDVHASNWSSILSGSFGNMQQWWWDNYIDESFSGLFHRYKGVSKYSSVMADYVSSEYLPGHHQFDSGVKCSYLQERRQSKHVFGWIQLLNHRRNLILQSSYAPYVESLNPAHKPPAPGSTWVVVPVRDFNREYVVEWIDPATGELIQTETITSELLNETFLSYWVNWLFVLPDINLPQSFFTLPHDADKYKGFLRLQVPNGVLASSAMGDVAFHCYLDCNIDGWQSGDLVEFSYPTTERPIVVNQDGTKIYYVNSNLIVNSIYWDVQTSTWKWSNLGNACAGVSTNIVMDVNGDLYYGDLWNGMRRCYQANGSYHMQNLAYAASDVLGPLTYNPLAHQVYYRSMDTRLKGIWWNWGSSTWSSTDMNGASGDNVSSYGLAVGPSGQVFYRTTDNAIHSLWYDGNGWSWSELAQTGNGAFNEICTDNVGKVFFVHEDGGVNCIYPENGNWYWSGLNNAETSQAYGHLTVADGRVYYHDMEHHINFLYFQNGQWYKSSMGGATIPFPARHVSMAADDSGQLFYVDLYGRIRRLAYRNQCDPPSEWVLKESSSEVVENGIESMSFSDEVIRVGVYPNPVSDILYVRFRSDAHARVSLCSIEGRVVRVGVAREGYLRLEVGDLVAGCYVLRVELTDGEEWSELVFVDSGAP